MMVWRAAPLAALAFASLACAPSVAPSRLPPAPVATVAAVAPPPAPAPLPFRLPCGDTDLEACQKGCDEHQREDCVTLASMYLRGAGVAVDKERALGMFRVACADGSARGCIRIADAYKDGLLANETEETDFYKKACDAGANQGCVAAGKAYLSGRGVGQDPAFAASLFDRVCARGNAEACIELAQQYRRGDGVKKSETKAHDLFDKACKLGLDVGCLHASKDGEALSPRD